MSSKYSNSVKFWTGIFARLLAIGEVWILVAIFNPPITSNVVWFIAILYCSLQASITSIFVRVD